VQQREATGDPNDRDDDVDVHAPAPVHVVGQQPAQQKADGAGSRRNREPQQPHDEHGLAAESVAQPAPKRKQTAEGQYVGGDHPLAAGVGEAEVGLRRGQGNVHDGRIQQDHDLGDDEDTQGHPASLVAGIGRSGQARSDCLRSR
jgi:hypothetical protein